jgi:hypothetical protein
MILESWRGGGFGLEWLGNDGDVCNACLFDGIHDGSESAERDIFVGAEINDLVGGVGTHLMELFREVVDVDGCVAEEDLLTMVDSDDQTLLGDFSNGPGLGDGDLDAGLKHWRCDHEDHKQDEDDVDQRRDVDFRERGAGLAGAGGEGHDG